ncbi:hypothetical protein A3A70_00905 [candidate division WWE3 bacterium RIFCSPLOWO2_01_FULL_42_11]|uniref:GTPase Obg n=1 Tax=candidate division WWE3 bacterium RIFCSPLOWO2_01_FULL_42_11 TaxID=1802627 RepID=A0A1F4VPU8_UNCKA|nr:MAG: hypothetical protein A3A70_00905 [candidate division WWE3 bacterium RIFCSPLOWO2_01_FULL_42_11]
MAIMIDHLEILCIGGNGGRGSVSFATEKFKPKAPPDGGDGGNGGNVVLKSTSLVQTFKDLANKRQFTGGSGGNGSHRNQHGKTGEDEIIMVPFGTQVQVFRESGIVYYDLISEGQEVTVAYGGRGGRGNAAFKNSRNRSPKHFEEGEPGLAHKVVLDLKIFADIGFLGLPNSGKSTLLNALTSSHSKIASYPFTTLEPQLGVMKLPHKNLIMADIPGIIEGASAGKGLGIRFLKHIERTKILIHLIDGTESSYRECYEKIRTELSVYSKTLLEKPEIVVITKDDLIKEVSSVNKSFLDELSQKGVKIFVISCLKQKGLDTLVSYIKRLEFINEEDEPPVKLFKEYTIRNLPRSSLLLMND